MPGHEGEFMLGMKGGGEKGKTRNVVPMGMGEHQGGFGDTLAEVPMAEIADAGSGVEDYLLTARIDFQAARVAAETDMIGRRAGDTATHAPEFKLKTH
jgi:hypothetical protein